MIFINIPNNLNPPSILKFADYSSAHFAQPFRVIAFGSLASRRFLCDEVQRSSSPGQRQRFQALRQRRRCSRLRRAWVDVPIFSARSDRVWQEHELRLVLLRGWHFPSTSGKGLSIQGGTGTNESGFMVCRPFFVVLFVLLFVLLFFILVVGFFVFVICVLVVACVFVFSVLVVAVFVFCVLVVACAVFCVLVVACVFVRVIVACVFVFGVIVTRVFVFGVIVVACVFVFGVVIVVAVSLSLLSPVSSASCLLCRRLCHCHCQNRHCHCQPCHCQSRSPSQDQQSPVKTPRSLGLRLGRKKRRSTTGPRSLMKQQRNCRRARRRGCDEAAEAADEAAVATEAATWTTAITPAAATGDGSFACGRLVLRCFWCFGRRRRFWTPFRDKRRWRRRVQANRRNFHPNTFSA